MASKQEAREGSSGPSGDAPIKEEKSGHKDKSVLQAKLTKLAIQIGYAGKDDCRIFIVVDEFLSDLWVYDFLCVCVCVCRFDHRYPDGHHFDNDLLHQNFRLREPAVEKRVL
jgi:hypothetical protein